MLSYICSITIYPRMRAGIVKGRARMATKNTANTIVSIRAISNCARAFRRGVVAWQKQHMQPGSPSLDNPPAKKLYIIVKRLQHC